MDIGTNAVSLSAWVNLDVLPSELLDAFGGIYDSNGDNYIMYLDRSNQELRFKVTDIDGNAERPGIPESLLTTNSWHHVLGVYDGDVGAAKIYFNGEPVDAHVNSQLDGLVMPGQLASIGANAPDDVESPSTRFFPGAIDDVAVWNRPLGRAEAMYLYNEVRARRLEQRIQTLPSFQMCRLWSPFARLSIRLFISLSREI